MPSRNIPSAIDSLCHVTIQSLTFPGVMQMTFLSSSSSSTHERRLKDAPVLEDSLTWSLPLASSKFFCPCCRTVALASKSFPRGDSQRRAKDDAFAAAERIPRHFKIGATVPVSRMAASEYFTSPATSCSAFVFLTCGDRCIDSDDMWICQFARTLLFGFWNAALRCLVIVERVPLFDRLIVTACLPIVEFLIT